MKANKIIKGAVASVFAALVITAGTFAAIKDCVGSGKTYPNLSTSKTGDYTVKCVTVKEGTGKSAKNVTIYGKSSADCAQAGSLASDPDSCNGNDLNTMIRTIINGVIFVVGMVAVVMIILGGVNYATSQGDPGKVKKGKDTIMYGIIGLVIAILAFAIINFIIGMLGTS
ncbi:MAG: pilin [Candidatus Saccharibacteria bacterium]|nr:pilin [Candidatus Saccharibacteria bacterium]